MEVHQLKMELDERSSSPLFIFLFTDVDDKSRVKYMIATIKVVSLSERIDSL